MFRSAVDVAVEAEHPGCSVPTLRFSLQNVVSRSPTSSGINDNVRRSCAGSESAERTTGAPKHNMQCEAEALLRMPG